MTTYMLDEGDDRPRGSPTTDPQHAQAYMGEPRYHPHAHYQNWSPVTPPTFCDDVQYPTHSHFTLAHLPTTGYPSPDMYQREWTPDSASWDSPELGYHIDLRLDGQQPLAESLASVSLSPGHGFKTEGQDVRSESDAIKPDGEIPDEGIKSEDHVFEAEGEDDAYDMSLAPPLTPDDDNISLRPDEPYAQLIYRAFMSKPNHSMTLQQLYQWFRENTNKWKNCKGKDGKEGNGWQNSIRHNLSMNHAFIKRDRPLANADCTPDNPPTADAGKKSTEWVLADWAVESGVESTTRYRNKDARHGRHSPVRNRHQTFYPHPRHMNQTMPGRARSGHRGGVAASRSRNAAVRGGRPGEQHALAPPQVSAFEPQIQYYPQGPGFPGQMGPDAGEVPAPFAHAGPHQQQQQPTPDMSQYTLGDVQGVMPSNMVFMGGDMAYGWPHGYGSPM